MKRFLLIFALFAIALSAQEKEAAGEKDLGWKWANFALLAIGLGYLIAKNLPPVFRSRTEEIQKGIVEAQALKRDAEKRAAEMQAKLAALGDEIEKFRTQARAEMEQESARIAEETGRQLEKLKRQTEAEIETAGKIAQRELRSYAARFALELAETRIRGMLDAKTEGALIQDFVRDLSVNNGGASKN
jgi:F0F1-type ATP synthase membrane subunit b/b'